MLTQFLGLEPLPFCSLGVKVKSLADSLASNGALHCVCACMFFSACHRDSAAPFRHCVVQETAMTASELPGSLLCRLLVICCSQVSQPSDLQS